ncbi:hypothetical protein SADUNF_Sadunf08G0101500 [Salix dunnii]|uniref:Amino acid permease/ SLC12A domain-containing protein n=1 Tax=Salix dunnii TaxID=1413687 RepID=A0A835JXR9_9ROSI|nr:hypothetical protein SADUNF_Sadunf08G0101500 [Salix dunnii]
MGGETTNLNEDTAGVYLPLQNDDGIFNDNRLKQLGYKQELSRTLSLIANFSVTFSIVSILTGLTMMYSSGLTYGGPVTMICSAYPTSRGLYFWSAMLCGKDWGPFASRLTGW